MSAPAGWLAAVIIAPDASEGDATSLAEAVRLAREIGAAPVVVAAPRGTDAIGGARLVTTGAGASTITALRLGMAQLGNSPARAALIVPRGAPLDAATLASLVHASAGASAGVIAPGDADLDRSPVIVARDAWLEVMTLAEQGMDLVAARRGLLRV